MTTAATEARANGSALVNTLTERLSGLNATLAEERAARKQTRDRIADAAHEAFGDHGYTAILELLEEFDLPLPKRKCTVRRAVLAFTRIAPGSPVQRMHGLAMNLPWGESYGAVRREQAIEIEMDDGGCACGGATFPAPDLTGSVGFIVLGVLCNAEDGCQNIAASRRAFDQIGLTAIEGFQPDEQPDRASLLFPLAT